MVQRTQRPPLRRAALIAKAETRAARLLDELGIRSAPVPVERVARHLELQVERADLGDGVSGILVVQKGRGVIGVNATHAPARQRFSVAHEIGHYLLHQGELPVFIDKQFLQPYFAVFRDGVSSTGEDRREREANAFAAALLMPRDLVGDAIVRMQDDVSDDEVVEYLAKRFEVSRQAMAFRLANLESAGSRATP